MDARNDTQSERIRQGISHEIKVWDDDSTKAEHQQFGKKSYNTTRFFKQLSNNAKTVHYDLCDLLLGQSFRTVPLTDERLAERTGLQLYQVSKVRRELANSSLVDVHPMISKSGKRQVGTYVYSFNSLEEITGEKLQKVKQESVKNRQQNVSKSDTEMCQKVTNVSEKETASKPDMDSVSEDQVFGSPEGITKRYNNNYYYNDQNDSISQVEEMLENDIEEELQRLQQTYWRQAPDKDRMRGTLADLLNQIAQEFDFPSNYAFKLLEEVSRDKGGIKFPQGFATQAGMEHLAQKAKPLKREVKEQEKLEQEEHERKLREKADQQRKLELEHRETVFQSLGSQFDKDVQNSIKVVIMDSSVYYDSFGNEKSLERKIDAFLSNQETTQLLYDEHIGTELDSDGVIEREEARKLPDWIGGAAGSRLSDFRDFIKRKILSDEQLQSLFTLDDDSKPQPPDNVLTKARQQRAKPLTPERKRLIPREELTLVDGGQFNEGLKQELITKGLIELEAENLGTWTSSMATCKMLAEAGMDSKELWKAVMSQAGDKPEPESVAGGSNEPVEQDDDQEPKLALETA